MDTRTKEPINDLLKYTIKFLKGRKFFKRNPKDIKTQMYKDFTAQVIVPLDHFVKKEIDKTEPPEEIDRIEKIRANFSGLFIRYH